MNIVAVKYCFKSLFGTNGHLGDIIYVELLKQSSPLMEVMMYRMGDRAYSGLFRVFFITRPIRNE